MSAERHGTKSATLELYGRARGPNSMSSTNGGAISSNNDFSYSIVIANEANKNQEKHDSTRDGVDRETCDREKRRANSATVQGSNQSGNNQHENVNLEDIYDLVDSAEAVTTTALTDKAHNAHYQTAYDNRGECCSRDPELKSERGLLYTSRERLKLKDFSSEIRASMDVEQFVHQAELILDMTQVSVEDIVEAMLERVILTDQAPSSRANEARQVIFTPGSSMLFARTIQGVCSMANAGGQQPPKGSTLNYDQSWLCALCSLAQTSRRHMIIARFKQPINMGENATEIRLFMFIVTPSKEKGTKNALDTGRTFATMLTDTWFLQRLLEARSETEFKSLMMVRAQQLSKAKQMKNRHKYLLDAAVHMSISTLGNSNSEVSKSSVGGLGCVNVTNCLRFGGGRLSSSASSKVRVFTFDKAEISSADCGDDSKNNGIICTNNNQQDARMFTQNPRASKLFELIAQANETTSGFADGSFDASCGSKFGNNNKQPNGDNKKFDRSSVKFIRDNIEFGEGLWGDFRRIHYYPSDFKDAFIGPPKTVQKTVATIWFLYFGILLPTIAFSALNTTQTHGHMGDLRKAIIGQAIGGLCFALFGGQPLVIIMTTAPLCLYTKVIHQMCLDYGYHFPAMYAAVGLWNGVFLTIYSLFGFSKLMKWCTRSTEEIFALFIVIAFVTDASKDLMKNLNRYYYTPACTQANLNQTFESIQEMDSGDWSNVTKPWRSMEDSVSSGAAVAESTICRRETSLLFILLMLGTLWLATTLYKFNKTALNASRYLEAGKRELLADYALPTAVIVMSYVGSYVFDDIFMEKFPPLKDIRFETAQIELLTLSGMLISLGLGFTLSLLFFMDQNISAAMVNAPQNRLKKGCAYHFDLLVVGILNIFLTFYGLPMMHGVLPHSPLHVRSLADIEGRAEEGHLSEVIVNVRETRVTGIVSHILVLGSLLLIPYPIAYIPTAVLNGLFLYMAITSLDGLQIFERILLLFTEQSKYPPNHYIRRCPQRKIHLFTMFQLIQLSVMCLFGFSPFNIVEMFFPVIILLMIPFRHKIVSKYIDEKYLDALDGKHRI